MGMVMSSSSGKGRGRRHRPHADINVTPFVDVMLVLLIVFMVTAPLLNVGVPVDLPQTQAASLHDEDEPLTVSVNAKGEVFIQETKVTAQTLVPRLAAISNNNRNIRVYVRGDRNLAYGKVMQVMGMITQAGFSKVALIAELPQTDKRG